MVLFRDFLIEFILNEFNKQQARSLVKEDFEAYSIPDDERLLIQQEPRCIYDIVSIRTDDIFKIRVYCKPDTITKISNFSIQEKTSGDTGFGDELWIADARIDIMSFLSDSERITNACPSVRYGIDNILLLENYEDMLLENNETILLE